MSCSVQKTNPPETEISFFLDPQTPLFLKVYLRKQNNEGHLSDMTTMDVSFKTKTSNNNPKAQNWTL